jgi:hypothetical protein
MFARTAIRLLKLSRHYEGAELLARAAARAANQLMVPLFMLLIMVTVFATMLHHMEWSAVIAECREHWIAAGASPAFLTAHAKGVTWACANVCNVTSDGMTTMPTDDLQAQLCLTCNGFPPGQPQCTGQRLDQNFPDVMTAMWFFITTVTPAGVDVFPITWGGKAFVLLVIILGLLFLAMPLSTMGKSFNSVWDERSMAKLQALVRQLLAENEMSDKDCEEAFSQFDTNGDGVITSGEFEHFVKEVLGLNLPKSELIKLWRMIDINNDGSINFAEFVDTIFPGLPADLVHGNDTFPGHKDAEPAPKRNTRITERLSKESSSGSKLASAARKDADRLRQIERKLDALLAQLAAGSSGVTLTQGANQQGCTDGPLESVGTTSGHGSAPKGRVAFTPGDVRGGPKEGAEVEYTCDLDA